MISEAKRLRINKFKLLYEQNFTIAQISKKLKIAKSTLYEYKRIIQDESEYPILKAQIKQVLLSGNLDEYVNSLSFSQLCCIMRGLKIAGYDKESKIRRLREYLSIYSILGLFPENLKVDDIKRAYRRMAKKTHPDLVRNSDKFGKDFQAVHKAYQYLMNVHGGVY